MNPDSKFINFNSTYLTIERELFTKIVNRTITPNLSRWKKRKMKKWLENVNESLWGSFQIGNTVCPAAAVGIKETTKDNYLAIQAYDFEMRQLIGNAPHLFKVVD